MRKVVGLILIAILLLSSCAKEYEDVRDGVFEEVSKNPRAAQTPRYYYDMVHKVGCYVSFGGVPQCFLDLPNATLPAKWQE
ncbi:hypothetical protein LCGC14_0480810 [marine sediment metagenome]|uniref:Uncharacterized protein n=1 Tax=marine sediment metagenome TaxID=412755 RepID=A0A0F9SSH9_9ZZZZ